ncbi:hypothetical protein IJ750_07660 [bacterium]|nr:hypothetical protein [bacterium]
MAINPVQPNIDSKKPNVTYRDAQGAIKTQSYIKPLPAEGHLVHDTLTSIPKYWVKDIAYDIKAVKDGFGGNANDHQTGRLNDVGLKLGGIGIAAYLASRTTDPKARVMEYVGLGTFLAAMSLYPKIAINTPSRAVHGFDIGKEYIDDQGRKKSVFQDSNYIPFDMYRGEYLDEDLDVIGDRMGIPRDIQNRHDLIKEQMRKIATQNNTLWMLTAGFATPVLTALTCCGLEKLVSPTLELVRNAGNNSKISKMLAKTTEMSEQVSDVAENKLSKKIETLLSNFKGKELPKEEMDKVIAVLTENVDENISRGIRDDLAKLFRSGNGGFAYSESTAQDIISTIKSNIGCRNKTALERTFVPTESELKSVLNRVTNHSGEITSDEIQTLKNELRTLFEEKINKETSISNKDYLRGEGERIIDSISLNLKKKPANILSEQAIKETVDFAKILGEFKQNSKILKKCKSTKFEATQESVLARSYEKFENTLFDVLDIKYKDLKLMRESEDAAKKILEEKMEVLAKDSTKYSKAVNKLTKVIEEMEIKLHGKSEDASHIKDLITAIENNYNKTAKRLNNAGGGKFSNTIHRLVSQDVSELANSVDTRENLFKILDVTMEQNTNLKGIDYVKEQAKGVGSSKRYDVTRIIERYQGVKDSFNRILHTMDNYRIAETLTDEQKFMRNTEYGKKITQLGRDALLGADTSQHTAKLGTVNNPELYKDIMNTVWDGNVSQEMKEAMGTTENLSNGNTLARFQSYINRFKQVMGNNDIDFNKPNHKVGGENKFTQDSVTRMSKFNLVGQTPIDFAKKAAERRYGNQTWLRKASVIGGSILGIALLSQFFFGKITNSHNIKKVQKQVSDDANK